jgi:uncharacterized protein
MPYFERIIGEKLKRQAEINPAILITGPRQTGKTTLARHMFPHHRWVLLDSPALIDQARHDPRLFLQSNPGPSIFDEVQRAEDNYIDSDGVLALISPKSRIVRRTTVGMSA